MTRSDLPIEDVIPQILAALREGSRATVTAPPGAGKTTRLPLALLSEPWAQKGKLIVVEPRRIAARAAAERMASTLGEKVGDTIGLRSRLDIRTSTKSRIEVVTEGVFTRMILSDPALEGIAAILFDEFHERSLDADEGLALALDAQSVLREDLRLIVMSATLPAGLDRIFRAPVISSDGRMHPVTTHYLGYEPRTRLEDQVAAAIRRALNEEAGSILAFLPGMAEIQRTAERLAPPPGVEIRPLYGALSPAEQNAAIAPSPPNTRKIVLATDIAESSLTIDGVNVVVDGGFARVPRFDPALGASRLETVRVSLSSAEQRRGRAGRTGPGVCYRLWREAEERGFAASPSPEIENADLTGLVLDLARWGARDPADLEWLNPPREASLAPARAILSDAGAIDAAGALTDLGKRIGRLAVPPRLAVMIVRAAEKGWGKFAAEIAAILSERDLGGRSTDIDERLTRFRSDTGQRARSMRDLSRRWAAEAGGPTDESGSPAAVLALGFPERIARLRTGSPGRFLMAGGRGGMMDETDRLAREEWIVAADFTGSGADLRITLAARMLGDQLHRLEQQVKPTEHLLFDPSTGALRARRTRRLGAIVLEDVPLPAPTPGLVRDGFVQAIRERGLSLLPVAESLQSLVARVAFLAAAIGDPWPRDFPDQLLARLDDWLGPLLEGVRSLKELEPHQVADAARTLLGPLPRDLDRLAPRAWQTPAGRAVPIDYSDGAPRAECKVQEVFGQSTHPAAAGVPLTLSLLSPAHRPVAITKDLPSFWTTGYPDLRKDMRSRYPKHDWPEDPAAAVPSTRTIRNRST